MRPNDSSSSLYSFCICLYWWVIADLSNILSTRSLSFFISRLWDPSRGTLLFILSRFRWLDFYLRFLARWLDDVLGTEMGLEILDFVVEDLDSVCVFIWSFSWVRVEVPFLLFLGPIQNNKYNSDHYSNGSYRQFWGKLFGDKWAIYLLLIFELFFNIGFLS